MNKEKLALEIVKLLQSKGYQAYWVGGSVRDILTDRTPTDFDIVTSAKPDEIEKLFPKTVPVGKKFGIIIVVKNGHSFEVATFRIEGQYTDARRPNKVEWTTPENDAKRRDFTINALFFDPIKKETTDFVNGKKDLQNKVIRFIGDPDERIKEDHLRILRAVRLKNCLGFEYDKNTKKAIQKNAKLINTISKERILEELNKMLKHSSRANSLEELSQFGILSQILPEVEKMKGVTQPPQFHSEGDVFIHTMMAVRTLPKKTNLSVVWGILLHDIGKTDTWKIREIPRFGKRITFYGHIKLGAEMAEKIAKRLRFSKKLREKVVFLVREHLRSKDLMKMKEARQIRWAQHDWYPDLLAIWKADSSASEPLNFELYDYAKALYERVQKMPQKPKPLLNGKEIMKILNLKSGPKVGQILESLVDAQLEQKVKTKTEAEKFVNSLA